MDFAAIDILNTICGVRLNPIILDEPFGALDNANRERVLELLEQLSQERQILVIDHSSEAKVSFSNVLKVEKRNGISAMV